MSTDTFRRHTRACVERATHLAFASLSIDRRPLFARLLQIARARSDLMTNAPASTGAVVKSQRCSTWLRSRAHSCASLRTGAARTVTHCAPSTRSLAICSAVIRHLGSSLRPGLTTASIGDRGLLRMHEDNAFAASRYLSRWRAEWKTSSFTLLITSRSTMRSGAPRSSVSVAASSSSTP